MSLNEDMVKPKSGSLQTHDNLSEESWLVPWCLWEAGGRALYLLALCTSNAGLWHRNRLEGGELDRPGRGTEAVQGEASLILRCPRFPLPAELLPPCCFAFSPPHVPLLYLGT